MGRVYNRAAARATRSGPKLAVVASLAIGCAPAPDRPTADVMVTAAPQTATPLPATATPTASATAATVVQDGAPLSAGLMQFTGMVRPTKGGFDVRSVTIDHGALSDALASQRPADAGSEWMLGAKLRVTAELVKEGSDAPPSSSGGLAVQSRAGTWFRVKRLERVEVVAPAVEIEGELARSKGLYSIAGHLVTADDLGWSLVVLNGQFEKKRVRLFGQPRTVHCEPNAQCLVGGSLPMFDVGRAEVVEP